jgi:class 3 adenylate cyclase
VQGSTELWEWDQQLASDAFKTHDRVLRQYMTQFYGYEVSTEGDAFLVAFHEPFDAVAWCLCVQLALHCERADTCCRTCAVRRMVLIVAGSPRALVLLAVHELLMSCLCV